ncbi:MAG: CbrC family protein [Rhizomicrobium sp.]
MDLPHFAYHPDPLASGSVKPSDAACRRCGQARGFLYVGTPYCLEELTEAICPWCIADGSAHRTFDAEFTDEMSLAAGVPRAAVEEVAWRTPGFSSWQPEQWLACCGDAAAFLEPAGHAELQERYPALEGTLIAYIMQQMGITGAAAHLLYRSLDRDNGPTAYVFQCRRCDNRPAYIDAP